MLLLGGVWGGGVSPPLFCVPPFNADRVVGCDLLMAGNLADWSSSNSDGYFSLEEQLLQTAGDARVLRNICRVALGTPESQNYRCMYS